MENVLVFNFGDEYQLVHVPQSLMRTLTKSATGGTHIVCRLPQLLVPICCRTYSLRAGFWTRPCFFCCFCVYLALLAQVALVLETVPPPPR